MKGTITTNTNTDFDLAPGRYTAVSISGTWDSATAQIYALDTGTAVNMGSGFALTANGHKEFLCATGKFRITTSGGGGSLSLTYCVGQEAKPTR